MKRSSCSSASSSSSPSTIEELAAASSTPELRTEVYAAGRLAIDPDSPAERDWLDRLAAALILEPSLEAHLDAIGGASGHKRLRWSPDAPARPGGLGPAGPEPKLPILLEPGHSLDDSSILQSMPLENPIGDLRSKGLFRCERRFARIRCLSEQRMRTSSSVSGSKMMHYSGNFRRGALKSGESRRRAQTGAPASVSDSFRSVALQLLIVATLALTTLSAWLMPSQLLLPSIAIAGLAVAALAAFAAWHRTIVQDTGRLNLWDVAGLFAFIGFGACMLSDPYAVIQFFASGDVQPVGRRP